MDFSSTGLAIEVRNRGAVKGKTGVVGPQGPQGPAGPIGPGNIDGGIPGSFYVGISNLDAGYYNETYGGILYSMDGGVI